MERENNRLESILQKRTIEAIKNKYGKDVWVYKTNDQCRIGIPDIILCFYGHFVSIELKRRNKRALKKGESVLNSDNDVTKIQKYNIKKINVAGGSGFVGRSARTIIEKLDKIRNSILYFK